MQQTFVLPNGLGNVAIDADVVPTRVTIEPGPALNGEVNTSGTDIDDLHHKDDWQPGQRFYDSTVTEGPHGKPKADSKLKADGNLVRITSLLETLMGLPGSQGIICATRIAHAIPAEHYQVQPFKRPDSTASSRFFNRIVTPTAPKFQTVMTFNRLNRRFRFKHYAYAVPMMAAVFGMIWAQGHFFKWLLLSPITLTAELSDRIGWTAWTILALLFILDNRGARRIRAIGASFARLVRGFLNKASISEEQTYREGCEEWTKWERVRSCIAFSLVHQPTLIYVFGMIIPHAVMGAVFMAVYLNNFKKHGLRRNAVLSASIFHRLYNRIALIVLVAALVFYFSNATLHWVMAAVSLGVLWTSMIVTNILDERRA